MKKDDRFIPPIESLRGVAALMVAMAHSIGGVLLNNEYAITVKSLLNIIANGGMGVTIFFVLSGFVLKRSLDRNKQSFIIGNSTFLWKRFLRIWPAMFVSTTCCAILINYFYTQSSSLATSHGYQVIWRNPVDAIQWLKDLAFASNALNLVTWTLQVEMVAALFMLSFVKIKKKSEAALLFILLIWIVYFFNYPMYSNARVGFTFMFILGMYIDDLVKILTNIPIKKYTKQIFYISFLLCALVNYFIPGDHKIVWFLMAITATINITCLVALHQQGKKILLLEKAFFKYIGKVSFSFYLWHFPVLIILITAVFNAVPDSIIKSNPNITGLIVFILSTLVTLPISHWSYHKIEKKFMATSLAKPPSN